MPLTSMLNVTSICGTPRRAADEDHFVDLLGIELGILQRVEHRLAAFLDEMIDELLELAARDGLLEMLGAVLRGGDEGEIDGRLHSTGELDLGLFSGFFQ